MKTRNLPVPPGPVAPLNWRYFWYVAPPAALTVAYRAIPPRIRRRWALSGTSTSHQALREIIAGGGWAAFAAMAVPYVSAEKQSTWRGPVTRTSTGAFWGLPFMAGPSLGWKEDYGRGSHVIDRGWLASYAGLETHGWGKVPYPPLPHSGASMENKELPDWFPTTGTNATWFEVQPTGMRRMGLRDLLGLLMLMRIWDQPKGYPANPPPSLNWNGPKKK